MFNLEIVSIDKLTIKQLDKLHAVYNDKMPESNWNWHFFRKYFICKTNCPKGYVLKLKDEIVGFIWGKLMNEPNTFLLNSLWIDEKIRGCGYGKMLIDELIVLLRKDNDIRKIMLHFRDSKKMENYYCRCGFTGHCIDGSYTNGEKKHRMEMIINRCDFS